jgi:hypothetical protein
MSDNSADYSPGTYGCHEALHLTSVLINLIERELVEHPAIQAHPGWRDRANSAVNELASLYQEIGGVHLDAEPGVDTPLTAEDLDQARKSLGPGSRSLLFGTSSSALDLAAERFKAQTYDEGAR